MCPVCRTHGWRGIRSDGGEQLRAALLPQPECGRLSLASLLMVCRGWGLGRWASRRSTSSASGWAAAARRRPCSAWPGLSKSSRPRRQSRRQRRRRRSSSRRSPQRRQQLSRAMQVRRASLFVLGCYCWLTWRLLACVLLPSTPPPSLPACRLLWEGAGRHRPPSLHARWASACGHAGLWGWAGTLRLSARAVHGWQRQSESSQ